MSRCSSQQKVVLAWILVFWTQLQVAPTGGTNLSAVAPASGQGWVLVKRATE